MSKPKVRVLISAGMEKWFYTKEMRALLASVAEPTYTVYEHRVTSEQLAADIGDAEVLFTDWGTPKLTKEVLDAARKLRVVCHAGGSVRFFMPDPPSEFFGRGLAVSAGTPVMSPYVAEHTLSMAIAVLRRVPFYRDRMMTSREAWWDKMRGAAPLRHYHGPARRHDRSGYDHLGVREAHQALRMRAVRILEVR